MDRISEYPPRFVKRPVMFQGWNRLIFLHWRYPAELIRALLPAGLDLDTFDGSAWIGLTPFTAAGLRPPMLPAQFPEMNVRTYVRGPDGERGIWFLTLEADRLAAVAAAISPTAAPSSPEHTELPAASGTLENVKNPGLTEAPFLSR